MESVSESCEVYYGVNIPSSLADNQTTGCVFTEKAETLKFLKSTKGSRFKVFKSKKEALDFCTTPFEEICSSPSVSADKSHADLKNFVADEKSLFKGPKAQDMTVLRRHIEKGEIEMIRKLVWNNPRYLISGGDTPTILQEGFRYNALHICAKSNQPDICKFIIDTVQDPEFMKLMYPDDSIETRTQRQNFLSDLYLNMPDKGPMERPLHFACKFGYQDVVKILALHPLVDKYAKNKYGESPYDMVAKRSKVGGDKAQLKLDILYILDSCHYVPLYRSCDETTTPVVGNIWSPSSASELSLDSNIVDAKSTKLIVKAYAGPMSYSLANEFRTKWAHCPQNSPKRVRENFNQLRRSDCDKGLERLGRKLADDMCVPWKEYWLFLKGFVNLSSEEGLIKLESYLRSVSQSLEVGNSSPELFCETPPHSPAKDTHLPVMSSLYRSDILNLSDCSDDSKDSTSLSPEIHSPSHYNFLDISTDSSFDSLVDRLERLHLDDVNSDGLDDDENEEVWRDAEEDSDEAEYDMFYDSLCEFPNDARDLVSSPDIIETTSMLGFLHNWIVSFTGLSKIPCEIEKRHSADNFKKNHVNDKVLDSPKLSLSHKDSITSSLRQSSMLKLSEDNTDSSHPVAISTPKINAALCEIQLEISNLEISDNKPRTDNMPDKLFIEGMTPTKLDLDVLRALCVDDLQVGKFPYIEHWKNCVFQYDEQTMNRWPSPARVKSSRSRSRAGLLNRSHVRPSHSFSEDSILVSNNLTDEELSPKKNLMPLFISNE